MILTYTEMCSYDTFIDRFRYLKLHGSVGVDTFGYDRYLNQTFYKSPEWRRFRNEIIARDLGCDLAHQDYTIMGPIVIHHLNPITKEDILKRSDFLMNPEYAVCVSPETHRAIHYGDESLLVAEPVIRYANDTCPWR